MSEPQTILRGERAAGLAGLLVLALAAMLALWLAAPPRPLPASAAADRFAAGRAMTDVIELSRVPRPLGSKAHQLAREYLLGRMAELGLAPEVQETTVVRQRSESRIQAARVRNLVGRLEGRGGEGGAVLLVAHYDSRPNTPGAGDDASGVAVVLETVRALAQGSPLACDLIVLLADGEELGLLGARGFAAEHPWLDEVAWVLNFEARGSRGAAAMFETGPGDLALVRAFARAAPYPMASSLSDEVYARMPNDTDFTPFRSRGLSGLNFAFIGGINAYHTALDTAERLDPASLQHAGANALALIREIDKGSPEGGGAGVWFNPLGGWLVVLPAGVVMPVAVILAVLTLALAVLGVRRGVAAGRAVWSASLFSLATLVLAPLAGAALWKLFSDNAAGVLDTPHGLPHRLEVTGIALLLAGVAVVAAMAAMGRRSRPVETALGVALTWSFLALLAAVFLPGASFLFWWPLWGVIAAIAAVVAVEPPRPIAVLFLAAGALPGIALLAPLAVLVFQAMTPKLAVAAMAPSALILALGLPALLAATAERLGVSLAALAASLGLLTVSVWGGPDPQRPHSMDLVHLEELDQGAAFWLSRDERLHPWVVERLGGRPKSWEAPSFLGFSRPTISKGAVGLAETPGPEAPEIEDERLDGRRLTVRVRSPGGAPMLRVEAISTVQLSSVELAGQRFERAGDEATRPLWLELAGFSPEGLEISFQLPDRWPVELHVTEQFYGLPETSPPPPELIPSSSWTSHSRLVHRSFLR